MAQQAKVAKALRFLKQNPRIPEKGIMYIGKKLQEEEEEGETQRLLGSAYRYLRNKRAYPVNHPLMRNVRRLGRAIRG